MPNERTLVLDYDVAKVLQYMETEVLADRLEYVAEQLPALARIIWARNHCASLGRSPIRATQSIASESAPAETNVGDDSVMAAGMCERK
jgi:hypothetical protein